MSAEDREPWVRMAEREKVERLKMHPGYRYMPHIRHPVGVRGRKRGDGHGAGDGSEVGMVGLSGMEKGPLRRTSSCPPFPNPQELPWREDERKEVVQGSPQLPPPIPRIPTRLPKEVEDIRSQIMKRTNTYEFGPGFEQAWEPDTFLFIPKPSTTAASTATTLPDANISTGPAAALPPSFLSLRRPSPCPPGTRRISSAQLTHPSATSVLQMTRDDLSSSLTYPGGGGAESAHAHHLGKNARLPLLDGPYRIDPPRDAPGWDAPPPRAYPWAWGWGEDDEDLGPRTAFDCLDLPQHLFGEVTRSDLQDISRAGLENIWPIDVDAMFHAQETAAPPPVFTNPFASAFLGDSSFGSYDTAGKAPASSFVARDRDSLGFDNSGGGGRERRGLALPQDANSGEVAPHHATARHSQGALSLSLGSREW